MNGYILTYIKAGKAVRVFAIANNPVRAKTAARAAVELEFSFWSIEQV